MVDIYLILAVLSFNAAVFVPSGEKDQKGVILLILKSFLYLLTLYTTIVFSLITIDNFIYFFLD